MMKRKTFTAAILAAAMIFGGAATGGAALAANSYVNICATAEEGTWTPSVVGGSLDERVPFGTGNGNWGDAEKFGTKLIEDPSMGVNRGEYEILVGGGWGQRYAFNYAFDLTDFEIVLDMTNAASDSQLALIFGVQPGVYVGAENGGFAVKILKHGGQYGFVVSNEAHVATIPAMTPAPAAIPWDAQNSGYVFEAADGILKIKFVQYAAGSDFTMQINDGDYYTIPIDEVTGTLGEELDNIYLSLGCISDGDEVIRVKSLKEGNVNAYEESVKKIVEALNAYAEAAGGDLSTAAAVIAAEELGDSVDFGALRSNDVAYWTPTLAEAEQKIADAKAALDVADKIELLEYDIGKLSEAAKAADSNDSIAAADEIAAVIENTDLALLEGAELGEHEADYNAALEAYDAALAELETARENVVLAYLEAYEKQAESVSSIADINKLTDYRNEIYVNLQKLDEATRAEVSLRLVDLQEKIAGYSKLDGWNKGDSVAVYNDGEKFEYSATNGSGSALSYGKKLMANQFSMSLRITEGEPGVGWFAFSLTKNQDRFYVCTDSNDDEQVAKMQENPGIVFMFELQGGNRLCVTVYLIKSTHTSFYSAMRGSMVFSYKLGDTFNIRIQAEDDANSTYANIFFNDQKFDGTNIKNSELKSTLGTDFMGYLSFCEDRGGFSAAIDTINGYNASDADLTEVPDLPGGDRPSEPGDSSDSSSESTTPPESTGEGSGCGSAAGIGALAAFPAALAIAFGKRKKH